MYVSLLEKDLAMSGPLTSCTAVDQGGSGSQKYSWKVTARGSDITASPLYYFTLTRPSDSKVLLSSHLFNITDRPQNALSSQRSTATPSTTSLPATGTAGAGEGTGTITDDNPATAKASNTLSPSSSSDATASHGSSSSSNGALRIGLGVGLGIGIPLLLLAVAAGAFIGLRLAKRRRTDGHDALSSGPEPQIRDAPPALIPPFPSELEERREPSQLP